MRAAARMPHLPSGTVRLRLTALYSGLFLISGLALLVAFYLLFRSGTGVDLIVPPGAAAAKTGHISHQVREMYLASVARNTNGLHQGFITSAIALAVMTAVSVALGWLVAGRVLRPLRVITATTRQISERNLNERLALAGPDDELKDLADTVDGLLARLEAHVEAQQRFAANASHELRTPLAITQTMLDVARDDPSLRNGELIDRLRVINTRAIDLTEALLLLSRTGQRSFSTERVDLSLIVEEAIETLYPLLEKRDIDLETAGEPTLTIGSHALLLQLATNLLQNAIVHNRASRGTLSVRTRALGEHVELTVENSGEELAPSLVSTLAEPFQRGTERLLNGHAGVGLGLAIVKSITEAHDGVLILSARTGGGMRATVRLPAAPTKHGA